MSAGEDCFTRKTAKDCAGAILAIFVLPGLYTFLYMDWGRIKPFSKYFLEAQFQVDSLSFSAPSNITTPATANWTIGFSVINPAKGNIIGNFVDLEVSLWYKNDASSSSSSPEEFLAATKLQYFSLPPNQEMNISGVSTSAWLEDTVARAILNDTLNGMVAFHLKIRSLAWYHIKPWHRYEDIFYQAHCRNDPSIIAGGKHLHSGSNSEMFCELT